MRVILKEPRKIVPLFIAALFFLTIYLNAYPYAVKILVYPVYREFKEINFMLSSHQFHVKEDNFFRIYYRENSQDYVDMVLNNALKSLYEIEKDFDYQPGSKIDIIIYPDYKEMANKIGLGTGSTAMGVYYGGIISILEPKKWISGEYDIGEIFTKEGPVLHELTHYVVDHQTSGNVPVWFTEGLALYEEYNVNGVEWGANKKYKAYYKAEILEKRFYELDETKAYRQSFLVIKYIADNFGVRSIHDIINELATGRSLDKAILDVLKLDIEDLLNKACIPG